MTRAVSDSTPVVARGTVGDMLLLVRHGETMANRRGHLLGRADPPLSADRAGAGGRPRGVAAPSDVVVSSPLLRARQTAGVLGPHVQVDERWIERDYGPFDDRPADAMAPKSCGRVGGRMTVHAAGRRAGRRARGARRAKRARSSSGDARSSDVVVVTHVSPIKAAIAWALGVPHQIAWRLFVEDASVSRIDIESSGPVVRWFNRSGG